MIVVSDTSPILNLSIINRLDVIERLFDVVLVPPAVVGESKRLRPGFVIAHWMIVRDPVDRALVDELQRSLDAGEAEAIALAIDVHADLILLDEHKGRQIAVKRGLRPVGLLGLLARAKDQLVIEACRPLLDEMIERAGLWIGASLRTRFLAGVHESE